MGNDDDRGRDYEVARLRAELKLALAINEEMSSRLRQVEDELRSKPLPARGRRWRIPPHVGRA